MTQSSQTICLKIRDIVREDRREFSFKELIQQGYDLRLVSDNELLQRLRENPQIELNEAKQTIKYKPKINAPTKEKVLEYIRSQKFKGVKTDELNDAYVGVNDDLTEIRNNPSKYHILWMRSEKDNQIYYFSDPKAELFGDLPQTDQTLIGEWKSMSVHQNSEEFIRTVNSCNLIPYHNLKVDEKKEKKD